jgi:hypothetical protein
MRVLSAAAATIFFAVGAFAETTNTLSDAEIQGRHLAQQILEEQPVTNLVQTGVLRIRGSNRVDVPIQFQTTIKPVNWCARYETVSSNRVLLIVIHETEKPNHYALFEGLPKLGEAVDQIGTDLPNSKTMIPFAGSDFWIADLGLEFFHWPVQKILRHDMKRGRSCEVLESTNPNPSTNGYSRVVSWIDNETLGIVHAEAYDFKDKLLKEFDPKSFKKVNGQWELQEMEIRNDQTGSRTRLEFDVKKE